MVMTSGGSARARYWHWVVRGTMFGALICLLALFWGIPCSPVAHASGPGYCGPLTEEHAPTRPALRLNHSEGPIGTNLTATARGWHPGAHVSLHFDGRDPRSGEFYILEPQVAQGAVAKDGGVTITSFAAQPFYCQDMYSADGATYQFDLKGGTTGYFVLASDGGEISAPVAFKYLVAPTVAVNQNSAAIQNAQVGTTVAVIGAGWEPHAPITVTLRPEYDSSAPMPYATTAHTTANEQGGFTLLYPLDARLRWNAQAYVDVQGTGPRFGTLDQFGYLFLLPAVTPIFRADRALVTPGMVFTVSGEHWYPGETYIIKYCNAQMGSHGWENGPNCGKESNPVLGSITAAADGRVQQQISIPDNGPPRYIFVRINELAGWIDMPPILVQVVDHLPTWDDIHPRVAALRNHTVAALPFVLPALLALSVLVFVGVRRWRARRAVTG